MKNLLEFGFSISNASRCIRADQDFIIAYSGLNRWKKSFVERNRIQSGLSDIVIPVEMGQNSGTMYTVDFSISQGKKLFIPIYRPEVMAQIEFEGLRYLISKYQHNHNPNIGFFNSIESLGPLINSGENQGQLFS